MPDRLPIPFNVPFLTGQEQNYITQALTSGHLSGDGCFSHKCSRWLEDFLGCEKALLTHSCTAALEIAALLANIGVGDEVIMPSYTFVSTANAFVLRGGVPVFVDIDPTNLNIDVELIEAAITPKTRAIVVVHYAGMCCDMNAVMAMATRHGLLVIEDAAQALISQYQGRTLGSFGHLSCFSFHETKNIISGEGGALIINDPDFVQRAEIIREKGTNRSAFFRGQVDKYSWVDIGSSYLPSDLIAAFLWAQLEKSEMITTKRLTLWQHYDTALQEIFTNTSISGQNVPKNCQHNAHMYYILLENLVQRKNLINYLKERKIKSAFHYVPLHSTSFGVSSSRHFGSMSVTDNVASCQLRLPLWTGLTLDAQNRVIDGIKDFFISEQYKKKKL